MSKWLSTIDIPRDGPWILLGVQAGGRTVIVDCVPIIDEDLVEEQVAELRCVQHTTAVVAVVGVSTKTQLDCSFPCLSGTSGRAAEIHKIDTEVFAVRVNVLSSIVQLNDRYVAPDRSSLVVQKSDRLQCAGACEMLKWKVCVGGMTTVSELFAHGFDDQEGDAIPSQHLVFCRGNVLYNSGCAAGELISFAERYYLAFGETLKPQQIITDSDGGSSRRSSTASNGGGAAALGVIVVAKSWWVMLAAAVVLLAIAAVIVR